MDELQPIPDPQKQISDLAAVGATDEDICQYLGIPEPDLDREFNQVLTHARASRRITLKKVQSEVAFKGNASMLIFLGKHELGQTQTSATDDSWPEPQLDPKVG